MSRTTLPKQLIPIAGQSLLQLAVVRTEGLIPRSQLYVCAAERHRNVVLDALVSVPSEQFIGEPEGRDTLAAIGVGATVIGKRDPDAIMAVFTADHLIEPVDTFQRIEFPRERRGQSPARTAADARARTPCACGATDSLPREALELIRPPFVEMATEVYYIATVNVRRHRRV